MDKIIHHFEFLAFGARATVQVGFFAFLLTLLFAFTAGICRSVNFAPVRFVAWLYVEIFRGTSLLVQLFWIYFSLPAFGIMISPITAGCLAIGLNSGAYGSEIVRGAIRSVSNDQIEASKALGIGRFLMMRQIILPQALPEMVPPFGNLAIMVLKDTALVSMISIADIAFRAQTLRTITYDSTTIYLISLCMYFAFSLCILAATKLAEHYVKPPYQRTGFFGLGAYRG